MAPLAIAWKTCERALFLRRPSAASVVPVAARRVRLKATREGSSSSSSSSSDAHVRNLASALYRLEGKAVEEERDTFANGKVRKNGNASREREEEGGDFEVKGLFEGDETEEEKKKKLPNVVIVGRPNVGKSALFNRLSGRQAALVADIPGVTRDRLYAEVSSEKLDFVLVDTGGLFSESDFKGDLNPEVLRSKMTKQVGTALEEAVALVFVVDGQEGVTQSDIEVLQSLFFDYF